MKTEQTEYKVFVNDKPFIIREVYQSEPAREEDVQVLSESTTELSKAIGDLERNKKWKAVIYLCDSPLQVWRQFVDAYSLIEAAGGLVKNDQSNYLLIYRRGKWDLPKGKLDYEESPEQAGVREGEEECGIGQLKIVKNLPTTFHTYPEGGKRILKKTHWYLMESRDKRPLVPQLEEDILEAVWMDEMQIKKTVYPKTYNSIRSLLQSYFGN
ncbi:MAG TPA: NUDIX domain-containing protein [Bacteroidia bacterium]|nr:NUDIX domain-containing protein [Bacteroidia bacterium]